MSAIAENLSVIRERQRANMREWIRANAFLRRALTWLPMLLVAVIKALPFLQPLFPAGMRKFASSWDWEMLRVYLLSFGGRAYMDQPCHMPDPPSFAPMTEVDGRWKLSEAQIKSFYDNGFIGPFTLCSPEEMAVLREAVWKELDQPSKTYGFLTGRDRHLDCPTVWKLLQRPEWTERLAQFLGPNLLLWRSQLFLKNPGAPEVTWHQASTYLSEEGYKATLYPKNRDPLFQLTTWVAFDDVDLANGCMQFLKGTHRRVHTMRIGGKDAEGFAKARIKLDVDITPDIIVDMPMKAGQFIIFSERCIHGSPPNSTTDRRRWGMAFRTIQPDVKIYDDEMKHQVFYLQEEFDLKNWGAVLLRGQDNAGINKLIDPFPELRANQAAAPMDSAA
jgi:non-heme Fe2+,alpha-ketoglutarate-dependent halogenase